jgi:phosphoribosylanthranilate isomerase
MNKLKIKICGMREPDNIKAVCKLKPDFMGFIFYPESKRFVSEDVAKTILPIVPEHIKKVGVFVNEPIDSIVKHVDLLALDCIQLHGEESIEYCAGLRDLNVQIIKSFGVDESFDFTGVEQYSPFCDYFLFDTKSSAYGGTGKKFNWKKLSEFNPSKPVFLSGGIGPEDLEAIQNLPFFNLYALDLNSKFETKPALKDVQLLEKFSKEIRNQKI